MEESQEYRIYHKIEAGKKVRIFKNTFNDKNFYKIAITQKNYDNTKDTYYQEVTFKRGVELENQSDIIIKKAYENCRPNNLDKYHPIHFLMITDFELLENKEQMEQNAYADFQQNLADNEIEISESDLPF